MKRIAIVICLMLCLAPAKAQPGHSRPERLGDDEIIRIQTKDIVDWLDLDGDVRDRFVSEYTSFRKEIDAVAKIAFPPQRTDDEDEIDKAIRKNFEISEKILDIRKKYYSRFRAFLKPSQIRLIYHIENEAGRRMHGGPGSHGGPEGHGAHGGPDSPRGPEGHGSHGGHGIYGGHGDYSE